MVTLVSVIIPCYNQGVFLNEALESVYNQIYTDWECIIVNDGSTDNTETVAQYWVNKDNRFKYFYKNNSGVSSTRNFGISKAIGEYIQFLDSDDILDKMKIQFSVDKLKEDMAGEIGMVVSNFCMLSSDSKEILPPFCKLEAELFTLESFLFKWNVTFSVQIQCGFFKTIFFENIRFPEKLSAQEDWVVWIQLLKSTKCIFVDLPLAYYRINPSSRMMTKGIDDNNIKVLDSFREILNYEEYYQFSVHLLTRFCESNKMFRNNLQVVKKSNIYQAGLMIRKIVYTIGLIRLSRFVFKFILRLKSS
ncbi:glycosyl transferase family 2 [Flavobacterium sp. 270]|uniref:glycosyltransferase family 2 protein n=1 Tax=Flavobacterium sp. 270 TaxID=2512114 RepID=UPI00106463E2|nr:glycosyltransferase family 2 protein [Flavobacterium sp. 270]TDW47149.1 glycosyl transferase family 2 [Flavobacterium sp. 270]